MIDIKREFSRGLMTRVRDLCTLMTYRNEWRHRVLGNGSIISYRTAAAYQASLW